MQDQNNTKTGEFISREKHRARSFRPIYIRERAERIRNSVKLPHAGSKIFRSAFACAVIVLSVVGLKAVDSDITNRFIGGVQEVVNSEFEIDSDVGILKFVNGIIDNAEEVSYTLPVDGEVVSAFSDTGMTVTIKSGDYAPVSAVLSGVVSEAGENYVVVTNSNGTVTTYENLKPCVMAGDSVTASDPVGELEENELKITTEGDKGYVDSLNMSAMLGN